MTMQLGCKRKAIVIDLTLSSEDESSEADGDACELTLSSGDESSDDTATVACIQTRRFRYMEFSTLDACVIQNDSSKVEQQLRLDLVKFEIRRKSPLRIFSALTIAAHLGRLKIMRLLLKAGAYVNVGTYRNGTRTPLVFAVVNKFYETTRLLLIHGATVDSMVLNSLLSKTLLPSPVAVIRNFLILNGFTCTSSCEEEKDRGAEVVWLVTKAAALVGARPTQRTSLAQSLMMKTKLNRPTLWAGKRGDCYTQEEFFNSKRPAQIWREAAALQRRLVICSERVDYIDSGI